MVEKKESIQSSLEKNYLKDEIYLHHKNKHFKHNSFVGFTFKKINKKINNKQILKTNSIGLRCEDLHLIKKTNTILIGGSVAFSSFASDEDHTISSLLEKNTNKKILNCGLGGHLLKQHFSLYFNYLKHIETKNIIILFGFNDLVNCYLGRNYDEILSDEFSKNIQKNYLFPVKSSLKTLFIEILNKIGLRKVFHNLLFIKNKKKINNGFKVDFVSSYINDIIKDIFFFKKYCEKFDIKLIMALQPSIYSSKKKLTNYEKNNFTTFLNQNPERIEFIKIFNNLLDKNLSQFKDYYNLESIYDEIDKTVFLDEVHLNDHGNLILSNYFENLLD